LASERGPSLGRNRPGKFVPAAWQISVDGMLLSIPVGQLPFPFRAVQ
jgi:hypothetical protein